MIAQTLLFIKCGEVLPLDGMALPSCVLTPLDLSGPSRGPDGVASLSYNAKYVESVSGCSDRINKQRSQSIWRRRLRLKPILRG